jgi:glycosyltransferase involved in cell wall biosynthesis
MKISVVIPSIARMGVLKNTLSDLSQQSEPAECIVILQGDDSKTQLIELQKNLTIPIRVIHSSEPNASLARNIGLREASGEIVLFLDDDVSISDPDFLKKHLRNYTDPATPGVYGQVLEVGQQPVSDPQPSLIETEWGWLHLPSNYSQRCRTRNGGSGNLSVRRKWAIAIGGMDAWFERGARREETEFNLRYTKTYGPLVFDPEASLVHLSAEGGSRNWGLVRKTVPMHHIVGHWYFLFAAMRGRTLGVKGIIREMRIIAIALLKNPRTGWNIPALGWNMLRALAGFAIAFSRFIRGPRRLDWLDSGVYREIELPAYP